MLLAIGIRRRRAFNRWNRRDEERLLLPGNVHDEVPFSQPPGRGTVFIVAGVLALILGTSHVLSYLAAWRTSSVAAAETEVGRCISAKTHSEARSAAPVDYTDPTANVKIATRVEGRAADAAYAAAAEVSAHQEQPAGTETGAIP
ncbi:hypothetical protein BCA37_11425 [Mycobacterium sp. djl-10]|nr:hypothetical protein BCA37_11425 [Mycobacterium sp. djl-10]